MTASKLDAIKAERQKVYGDPRENHRGIAMAWAGLLQPHAPAIARGDPIPDWTVALMMAALKLNRMRLTFKQDNYDDIRNYLEFAEQWQQSTSPGPCGVTPSTTSPPSTPPPP
jgi:hypothetical protein